MRVLLFFIAAAVEVTPVEKVITLLQDLQNQVEEEGRAEAATYDTFACFCKDKTNEKVDNINTKESNIKTWSADLSASSATAKQLGQEISTLEDNIAKYQNDLKEMTEIREQERAVYEAEFGDASKAVDALHGAIQHLSTASDTAAALTEVKAVVAQTMAIADALNIAPHNKGVAALLQQKPDIPDEDYSFHSGGIIDTLNELLDQFSARKDELHTEEEKAVTAFEAASSAKQGEIDSATTEKDTKEGELATTKSKIAQLEQDLTEEKALLNDDKAYLKDMTGRCENRATEWDQRSSQRKGELTAISQALAIISGTVAEKASVSGAGGREAATPTVTEELQVDESSEDEQYEDVVFVQTGLKTVHKHGSAEEMQQRNKAISMIKALAQKSGSAELSLLAMKMAADPFAKVKRLIQKLIERLLAEATNEATHKGWCDTELGKSRKDRDYRHKDTQALNSDIAELEARKASLEEEISTLTGEISSLNSDLFDETENRNQVKAENKQTLKDAKEGLVALNKAIGILTAFYKNAAKAFVQASPVDADSPGAGFDGNYQGNQAQGTGIIGMLETIASDFERTLKNTAASEAAAARAFVAFKKEAKVSISTKETGLRQAQGELESTNGDLVAALNDLQDMQNLLDASIESLEKLRPACIDTGMSWEERKQRRENEIGALKKALCVLDEEDQEIAECKTAFLQRK